MIYTVKNSNITIFFQLFIYRFYTYDIYQISKNVFNGIVLFFNIQKRIQNTQKHLNIISQGKFFFYVSFLSEKFHFLQYSTVHFLCNLILYE